MTFMPSAAIAEVKSFLSNFFFKKKHLEESPVRQIHAKRNNALAAAKQAELDALCKQLFKKKELITSGKLQFIGLTKIKKRMGKQWAGLCKIVYDTAEDVIDKYLEKGDIFIRYQDETYVIIFAHASLEEGQLKAGLIADEIRQRLFEMDEKELRDLEIRNAISEIRTDILQDLDFVDMIDFISAEETAAPLEEEEQDEFPIKIDAIEVGTKHKRVAKEDPKMAPVKLSYSYMPIWDTQRGALTTYLCLASKENSTKKSNFDTHQSLYTDKTAEEKTFLDQKILEIATHELETMEREGRKLFIVCPVQHETVYHFDRYEIYKNQLSRIPLQQRQFLILMVINMQEKLIKDPYWFATPLRQFCRHVFAEVPLRRDINFGYLRTAGVDAVGVKIDTSLGSEQQIITLMNSFSARAKAMKIGQTFIMDISTLSLTTSAVCAGFTYMGGSAIHDAVTKPDTIHRYRHEDLLSSLTKKSC